MRIAITGGFGKIGTAVIEECLSRGHRVSVFDIDNRKNRKTARRYGRQLESVHFGDIRRYNDTADALIGVDAVVHLAGITPPKSEQNPKLCRHINVGGTENVLKAIRSSGGKSKFIYISSATVMGPVPEKRFPITAYDDTVGTDNYSSSKIEAERAVRASGIDYAILRPVAVMTTKSSYSLDMMQLLSYQNHTFTDFKGIVRKKYRFLKPFVTLLPPVLIRTLFRGNSLDK